MAPSVHAASAASGGGAQQQQQQQAESGAGGDGAGDGKKKRKDDPHRATVAAATLSDCVLAAQKSEWVCVNNRDKKNPASLTRLLSIKGVDIKKIQLQTLRDCAKERFGKFILFFLAGHRTSECGSLFH